MGDETAILKRRLNLAEERAKYRAGFSRGENEIEFPHWLKGGITGRLPVAGKILPAIFAKAQVPTYVSASVGRRGDVKCETRDTKCCSSLPAR